MNSISIYKNGSNSTVATALGVSSALNSGGIPSIAPGTVSSQMSVLSYYSGTTIGGAFAINDVFTLAIGFRHIYGHRETRMNAQWTQISQVTGAASYTSDFTQQAHGIGEIIGLNITPAQCIFFAIKYETRTRREFITDVNSRNGTCLGSSQPAIAGSSAILPLIDGDRTRRDLAGMIATGISCMLLPALRAEIDFNYYFTGEGTYSGSGNETINQYGNSY